MIMQITNKDIRALVEYVKIDSFSVVCHFRCKETNKSIVSKVSFEPYDGKIEITWKDILLHPIKSYNRYFHTPITIYSKDTDETIVNKAFKKIANHFRWSEDKKKYILV
jgi:hypothetical protein